MSKMKKNKVIKTDSYTQIEGNQEYMLKETIKELEKRDKSCYKQAKEVWNKLDLMGILNIIVTSLSLISLVGLIVLMFYINYTIWSEFFLALTWVSLFMTFGSMYNRCSNITITSTLNCFILFIIFLIGLLFTGGII